MTEQGQPIIERRKSFIQKHGDGILSGAILAGIVGIAALVWDVGGAVKVMQAQLASFDTKLSATDARFQLYQTKEAARAEREAQALRDQMTNSRIDQVKDSLDLYQRKSDRNSE